MRLIVPSTGAAATSRPVAVAVSGPGWTCCRCVAPSRVQRHPAVVLLQEAGVGVDLQPRVVGEAVDQREGERGVGIGVVGRVDEQQPRGARRIMQKLRMAVVQVRVGQSAGGERIECGGGDAGGGTGEGTVDVGGGRGQAQRRGGRHVQQRVAAKVVDPFDPIHVRRHPRQRQHEGVIRGQHLADPHRARGVEPEVRHRCRRHAQRLDARDLDPRPAQGASPAPHADAQPARGVDPQVVGPLRRPQQAVEHSAVLEVVRAAAGGDVRHTRRVVTVQGEQLGIGGMGFGHDRFAI